MQLTMERRLSVKSCVELQKSPSETLEMLKAVYSESAMGKSNIMLWQKRFRKGREGVKVEESQGAPVTKLTEDGKSQGNLSDLSSGYLAR